jgi:hypothetical protein
MEQDKGFTALIDADLILYRIGWTTEDVDSSDIVASRIDNCVQNILEGIGVTDYRCYLSCGSNYRTTIYPLYKSSRLGKPKPRHYDWIKAYLYDYYAATHLDDYEADDLLGINQSDDTIICSIDKDLLQIPGNHFNFVTGLVSYIDQDQANLWFCKQLLMGDSTDDIPGVPLITKKGISDKLCFGPKSVVKELDGLENPMERVVEIYKKVYKDSWEEEINLRGSLVDIRKSLITDETPIWRYNVPVK